MSVPYVVVGVVCLCLWLPYVGAQVDETAPNSFQVRMGTTNGEVILNVRREWAPIGVDRFYTLIKAGYYNNNAFFRVIRNDEVGTAFVAQWGINGVPSVSAVWEAPDRVLPNEGKASEGVTLLSNTRGTIAFAAEYTNTTVNGTSVIGTCCRSTQLYVNYGDNSRLDALGFVPFAIVTKNMQFLDRLYSGYGEEPDQELIYVAGNPYLTGAYPLLDYTTSVTIVVTAGGDPIPEDPTNVFATKLGRERIEEVVLAFMLGLSLIVGAVIGLDYYCLRRKRLKMEAAAALIRTEMGSVAIVLPVDKDAALARPLGSSTDSSAEH